MSYVSGIRRPPRTLTAEEQTQLLRVTGKYRDTFRDHVLFSLALGTGLREHELAALNVGDVAEGSKVRRRVKLRVYKRARKRKGKPAGRPPVQEVFLTDANMTKLARFLAWKRGAGEGLAPAAPLFVSQRGGRLATRTLRHTFATWQTAAGFDGRYTFHELRHSAVTNLYRQTKDIRIAQRHARHANVSTTQVYTHVADEDLLAAVRRLRS